jgi:hypothetical protein
MARRVARANALQSRNSQGADADAGRVRALAAYKEFLTLSKDADPDIPIRKKPRRSTERAVSFKRDTSFALDLRLAYRSVNDRLMSREPL